MTSESMVQGRRNTVLAAVIGTVLASFAGSASALEFESDGGTRVNWNTTLSVGSSWRATNQSKFLYTHGDASLLGRYTGNIPPGVALPDGNGRAGNWSAGESTLNYDKGDRFSTPFKILSDVEVKKGDFGGLVRIKAWYDQALNENEVNLGNQANFMNGTRVLGPTAPNCSLLPPYAPNAAKCIPMSTPGHNVWPKAKLSDDGFEDEQKFDNLMLLDAYVYGSFALGNTDLQLRLGNQVVNWGESVFIQGVNQINPIDVPAARRAGAELKEILLPVWMAYANWGFSFGSVEAFYQLQWNNTSIDGCGTYWGVTSSSISTSPGNCNLATAFGPVVGTAQPGTQSPLVAQYGSAAWYGAQGLYVPLGKGKEPSDNGQFGVAFRFPVDKLDTEFGLYAMNIHSRLPVISSQAGTSPNDLTAAQRAVLTAAGLYGVGTAACGAAFQGGACYKIGTSNVSAVIPFTEFNAAAAGQAAGVPIKLTHSHGFWEYPEDIQIYGLSTASNLFGWSVSSELSYQKDVPVQINGNDFLLGAFALFGPHRADSYEAYMKGSGAYLAGYDRFDKTQFQVNTVKTYSNVLGADNMLIVGEVGAQWNDVPNHMNDVVRYGRGFMWGYASSPGYANSAAPAAYTGGSTCSPTFQGLAVPVPAGTLYNPNSRGCKNDGFVTDKAWGYRLRVSADYLNAFNSGVTVTPSVFYSKDVDGISMDPTFQEGRGVLGLGMKFTYNKAYTFDVNYVSYADQGYDPLQDRDFYSASVSVTF
jgi:hypothetical protein